MPTKPVACRVSLKVYNILLRRSGKQGIKISEYLMNRITYDALRKR